MRLTSPTSRHIAILLVALSVISANGCASTDTPTTTKAQAPPTSAVHARYVVLGSSPTGETIAWARAIIDPDQPCPTIDVSGDGDTRIAMSPRINPHGFPVTVCEAAIPMGKRLTLALDGTRQSLPTVTPEPTRILIMGDTGCKTKDCTPGTPAEPFASLAKAAAASPPEVILHMGDYNYRGTGSRITVTRDGQTTQQWSYDAGDGTTAAEHCMQADDSGFYSQNAPGSSPRDSWDRWRDDFFAPAGSLLWSAPWVLARGNHELCSRAGPGWFYFLDPSSNLPGGGKQLSCPVPDHTRPPMENVVMTEPYRVDLGSLHVVVLDSTNACDAFVTPAMSAFTRAYDDQFNRIRELTPDTGTTWLMTHRPIWGVQAYSADKSTGCTPDNQLSCMNQVMQASIETALGGALPARIRLSLAGHMHQFQSLTFKDASRPPQVTVGNSGVRLALWGPAGDFDATVQGIAAHGLNIGAELSTDKGPVSGHAFLRVDYRVDGTWSGTLLDPRTAAELATCGSETIADGRVCTLAPGVSPPVQTATLQPDPGTLLSPHK